MECKRGRSVVGCFVVAAIFVCYASSRATAEPKRGMVYNPVTQQMEPNNRTRRVSSWPPESAATQAKPAAQKRVPGTERAKNAQPDFAIEQASYEETLPDEAGAYDGSV